MLSALYDWPTWLIIVCLLGLMLAGNELGYRLGTSWFQRESEISRSVSNTLKGSILGLVALLLGFSFSATTTRYDIRQRIVLDQSNAIGTCYLRAELLPSPHREMIQDTLRTYVADRLALYHAGTDADENARLQERINRLLAHLWDAVSKANSAEPDIVRNSMIVPAANEVIDLSSTRGWANRNHLPNPVFTLLVVSVLVSSFLLGHSSGQTQQRHVGLWMSSNIVFALVLFVVLDFDRPRRGLITIDQTPLVELQGSLE